MHQRALPWPLFVIAAVLLVGRFAWPTAEKKTGRIDWLSPEAGIARAQQTGKPIVFDFTAEWCGPCHVLDAQVFADAELAARINKEFVAIRITDRQREEGKNSPQVAELQRRYSVRGFPTVVFADANGVEQARMEGFRGRAEFERLLKRASEELVR